jgi:ketosteroid isomerase-like protein
MRTLVWMAAVSCVTGGCSASTGSAPPPPPVDWRAFDVHPVLDASRKAPTAKELAVAQSYAQALSSPGLGELGARLDDDIHFSFPGMDDAHGRDAVVHAHANLFGGFDERRVATTRVLRTDSVQTLEWTLSGIHAHDWMGVPATRKPVVFRGFTILWTKDDGSIVDVHVYFDVAVVKAQLGAGPKDLLALPAPSQPSSLVEVFDQTGSPEENIAVNVAHASLDALEGKDEAAYVDNKTEDVEVHSLERAQVGRGREDARAYFKTMHKAIGQLDTTVDNAWGIAQFAVEEYTIAGEQMAPLGWIPVKRDKVILLHVAQVNEVRDGKIARVWRYDNPSEIVGTP